MSYLLLISDGFIENKSTYHVKHLNKLDFKCLIIITINPQNYVINTALYFFVSNQLNLQKFIKHKITKLGRV